MTPPAFRKYADGSGSQEEDGYEEGSAEVLAASGRKKWQKNRHQADDALKGESEGFGLAL